MRQDASNNCRLAILRVMGAAWLMAALGISPVLGAEEPGEGHATVRKTKNQLHFEVPPDWPIEERGGIVGPIPVEEYLAKKFNAIAQQLHSIEQRLNGLDIRLRVIEEGSQKRSGLRSQEHSQTSSTPSRGE